MVNVGGDIIIYLNDQAVNSVEDLAQQVGKRLPGQEVTLTALRDGERIQIKVTLGERPS